MISALFLAAIVQATEPTVPPDAATEAAAGVEAYRVTVNSYRASGPTIVAFERRPGQPPKVVVYSVNGTMEAPASAPAWRSIQDSSEYADRRLVPLSPDETPVVIGADGSQVSIEIINGPERHLRQGPVRTASERTTGRGGLATKFGDDLLRLAIDQFPACAALTDDGHGNHLPRLTLCMRLSGDTVAAASAANQIGGPMEDNDRALPRAWRSWMGWSATPTLDWSGQVITETTPGDNQVSQFLAAQNVLWTLHEFPRKFEGIDRRTVRVTGTITRQNPTTDDDSEQADYEQRWVFDQNPQAWVLETWRVGTFGAQVFAPRK